jgi:hypothetical protein
MGTRLYPLKTLHCTRRSITCGYSSGSLGQDPRCKCYCNDSTTDKKLAAPKVPILG